MTRFASTPFVISACRTLMLLVLLINPPSLFFSSMSIIDYIADVVNFTVLDSVTKAASKSGSGTDGMMPPWNIDGGLGGSVMRGWVFCPVA